MLVLYLPPDAQATDTQAHRPLRGRGSGHRRGVHQPVRFRKRHPEVGVGPRGRGGAAAMGTEAEGAEEEAPLGILARNGYGTAK